VVTSDGTKYPAVLKAVDPLLDFALIKVEAKNLSVATLGDSEALEIGQSVIAVGNALGEFQNTVTTGVISAKGRDIQAGGAANGTEALSNLLQTDTAINPGNSGGPLVNLAGQVIGVNTAVSESAQGIGFAIPINQVKQAIDSYTRDGKIVRPSLGVRYVTIDDEVAQLYNLPVKAGALLPAGWRYYHRGWRPDPGRQHHARRGHRQ
jgi:serine protease Do